MTSVNAKQEAGCGSFENDIQREKSQRVSMHLGWRRRRLPRPYKFTPTIRAKKKTPSCPKYTRRTMNGKSSRVPSSSLPRSMHGNRVAQRMNPPFGFRQPRLLPILLPQVPEGLGLAGRRVAGRAPPVGHPDAALRAALARAPAGKARGGLGKRPWACPPHDVSFGAVC